jgi:hypothetical protein
MRLLIYGMQSSGASTLAYLLAQRPGCAAFIDVWALYAAPALPDDGDVVAKVVVTTAFPLALHQERFRPDRTILFLRHPQANHRSLAGKSYRHHCGFMEEKFAVLDDVFVRRQGIDAVLHYEDLVFDPVQTLSAVTALGWPCDPGFVRLRRGPVDIRSCNEQRYPWLAERLEYDVGNHHFGPLSSQFADLPPMLDPDSPVREWCPAVTAHYEQLVRERGSREWPLNP